MRFYTNVAVVGSNVLVREIVDGIPNMRKHDWCPTIYVKGKPKNTTSREFKTLYGDTVYALNPGSIPETREFIKKYEGIKSFDIFGQLNYSLQYMNEYGSSGWSYKKLSSWAIDIETTIPVDENGKTYFPVPETADGEVLLITMTDMHTGNCFTFGTKSYSGKDTHYTECTTERHLFKLFLEFWEQRRVDIITGWNIAQFDLPYLCNRIKRILGEDAVQRLSPWGRVSYKNKLFLGKVEYSTNIVGVSVLDYIDMYKKYVLEKQESYSLGHIAQAELGNTKVDHSEYGTFTEFYEKNWEKFTYYNIIDTLLIKELDDKLKLIELVLTMSYEASVNYEDVSSPVKLWDAIINNYCIKKDIVLPQQQKEVNKHLDGAYVKDPIPGWYKNVVSLDATSLYPSIIMTNNISPETWVGNCGMGIDDFLAGAKVEVEGDKVVTPAGAVYTKERRGILPELVEYYMKMRKTAKTEMLRLEQEYENTKNESLKSNIAALDAKQMAIKTMMNSLYGATANEHFRFFKHDHAASITLTGQYVLRTIESKIDAELNVLFKTENVKYLIYIDTDSLYFTLDAALLKNNVPSDKHISAIEKIGKVHITNIVNKICAECCGNMRSLENKISFKLEIAADKCIWLKMKKYVVRAHSSEGVTFAKPKFKVKGLEMVRSSTPRFVREKLKLALDIIFNTDEKTVQKFIEDVRVEFMQLPYTDIAFPRGANNLLEYSAKDSIYKQEKGISVPIQVRAVLLYNHWLKHYGLAGTYPLIGEGEKIKFLYLKTPNKLRENVIAFPVEGKLPSEFGIDSRIDYEMQFQKTFLASMSILLNAIKWEAVETSSLDAFFV